MVPEDVPIGDWLSQDPSDPAQVAGRYDDWAQSYDDDLAAWSYQAPGVVSEAVVTQHPSAGSVLDVGCGTGLVGRALRGRGFAGRIVGVDISQASLDLARERGGYDALDTADLQQRLAFDDDTFDAVVCVGVMTYLPDVEAVWREFARVARPGGVVVVTQREDLWGDRDCQDIVDRLQAEGVWQPLDITGPAPYLPDGYGGTPAVGCYYLTARVEPAAGPYFHGTKAALEVGDELVPGYGSNFQEGRVSNNIYFTGLVDTAAWGAELATALAGSDERGHIYVVEPLGPFEDDPNVTDKKFPGNPTQSYRTRSPLRIVAEVESWEGHAPEVLQGMLDSLARLREQGLDVIED
jgi:rifampin ADP-ribosylating transferase